MAAEMELNFVVALPGWEVLYYSKGGRFETAPIVAWGIYFAGDFVRAVPITTDLAWLPEDSRVICTPDGDVTRGDVERWPTVWAWLEDMKRRESEGGELPPDRPAGEQAAVEGNTVVLDNYRRKFQEPT